MAYGPNSTHIIDLGITNGNGHGNILQSWAVLTKRSRCHGAWDEGVAGSNPATPTSFPRSTISHGERYGERNPPVTPQPEDGHTLNGGAGIGISSAADFIG